MAEHAQGINGRLALWITNHVGTMWCAYLFTVLAAMSFALPWLLLLTQNLLPLVLLPIIIVGQNLQAKASDARAEQTYKDAEAVLAEALQIQQHLAAQDAELTKLSSLLSAMHTLPTKR